MNLRTRLPEMKNKGYAIRIIITLGLVLGLLGFGATLLAQEKKSQFERGETLIFVDSLKNETLGEFPSKWDLETGTIEINQWEGIPVIAYMSRATIMPLMSTEDYLPEIFTVEFDVYFHLKGNEAYKLNLDKLGEINIRSYYVTYKGTKGMMKENIREPNWKHVAISFNKRALKMYVDDYRVLNIPNVTEKPTNVSFGALSHGARTGLPSVITNVVIAEGGEDLYERVMTAGKLVMDDIHFETASAILKPESTKIIDKVVKLMKEHTDLSFSIEGHTDGDGTDESNLTLSEKRAEAVRTYITENGVAASRLTVKGFGESKPIASNDTDEGKAKNRRVEFVVITVE